MKKTLSMILIGFMANLVPLTTPAADKPPSQESIKKKKAARSLPFHGTIVAVDQEAKTITVGKRIFHLTPTTKASKDGKPVSLSKEMIGQRVGGAYVKKSDGSLRAVTIRLKTKAPKKNRSPKKPGNESSP